MRMIAGIGYCLTHFSSVADWKNAIFPLLIELSKDSDSDVFDATLDSVSHLLSLLDDGKLLIFTTRCPSSSSSSPCSSRQHVVFYRRLHRDCGSAGSELLRKSFEST